MNLEVGIAPTSWNCLKIKETRPGPCESSLENRVRCHLFFPEAQRGINDLRAERQAVYGGIGDKAENCGAESANH